MSAYVELLALEVLHAWGPDGRCGELHFDATPRTARWLQAAQGVSRSSPGRFEVLLPGKQLELRRDDHDTPALTWFARLKSRGFGQFTAGLATLQPAPLQAGRLPARVDPMEQLPRKAGEIFCFDGSRLRPADDGGAPWLHAGATAGPQDVCGADTLQPLVGGTAVPPTQPLRAAASPDFVVSLPWPLLREGKAAFRIAFEARSTLWKYCLLGDWSSDAAPAALRVVDPDEQADFAEPVPERLDDGQPCLAIRSTRLLALRSRSAYRFQLRSRTPAADRVLVRRLPVAGSDHFALERFHGEQVLVSEIYVHR